jgi:stress responsive alpha/beta barrel protein
MRLASHRTLNVIFGAALLISGIATGNWRARSVSAQNRFGQPKTVLHVVIYKWKPGVSEGDQQRTIDGIRTMAAKIPGIKNVWLKTERNQLRDFSGVFAIEFASPDAAADYAESKVHEAWSKQWLELRETSLSFQVSNP